MFEKKLEVPQKTPADYLVGAIKVTAAALSWWAAPGVELAAQLFGTPIERRRDEFLEDLAWVVRETAAKVDDLQPEKFSQNEAFVSATQQAWRIAMSTHQREKREYLRNALLNIALGKGPDELKQQIFLNAIEAFAPAHVRTLDLLWKGAGKKIVWDKINVPLPQRTYFAAIQIVAPELKNAPELIQAVLTDLRNRGFSNMGADTSFPQGPMTTNLGIEFLHFVQSPEDLDKG